MLGMFGVLQVFMCAHSPLRLTCML
jgi:hypothetical protein